PPAALEQNRDVEEASYLCPRNPYQSLSVPVEDILVQPLDLPDGKLDFAFRFRRHAVAGSGPISPAAYGFNHVAVASHARAFQDQRAVHVAVSTDDEADSHS